MVDVYNPTQALDAYGVGRERRTRREVSSALGAGDYQQAQQAAFQGGNIEMGLGIRQMQEQTRQAARQAAEQADTRQLAQMQRNARVLGGVAASALREVPEDQLDQYIRSMIPTLSQNGVAVPQLPNRRLTRADLEGFVAQAQAMDGELSAYLDRTAPQMQGQNEAFIGRRGGQDFARLNPLGERIQTEEERAARVGEALEARGVAVDEGRLGLQERQFEAEQRQLQTEAVEETEEQAIQSGRRIAEAFARQEQIFNLINQAKEQVGPFSAGFFATPSWLGGTPGANLEATLDTVRANIGFEELNRMRQMSPTGGALGQVTERELRFLQSVMGSLERSQSPQQLRDNLLRVEEAIRDSRARVAEAYRQDFGRYPPGFRGVQETGSPGGAQTGNGGQQGREQSAAQDQAGGKRRPRYNPQTGELE